MFPVATGIPLRYPPIATWALIATNCVVFLFEVNLSPSELDAFLNSFALIPARYFPFRHFRQRDVPDRLSALCQQHVSAWRLAAPDRQHVDVVAVRGEWSRSTGLGAVSRFLFRVRRIGGDNLRGSKSHLHYPGAGCLGSNRRGTRLLHAPVPILANRCRGSILFLPLFFEVPAMLFAGLWSSFRPGRRGGLVHIIRRRRYRMVGPYWRLSSPASYSPARCGPPDAEAGRAMLIKAFPASLSSPGLSEANDYNRRIS